MDSCQRDWTYMAKKKTVKSCKHKLIFCLHAELGIFHTAKRTDDFVSWEPFYIGTNADPYFDERLSWEGKQDKMSQV